MAKTKQETQTELSHESKKAKLERWAKMAGYNGITRGVMEDILTTFEYNHPKEFAKMMSEFWGVKRGE